MTSYRRIVGFCIKKIANGFGEGDRLRGGIWVWAGRWVLGRWRRLMRCGRDRRCWSLGLWGAHGHTETQTHTHTHTKVKTVYPPVSLRSLGGYNKRTVKTVDLLADVQFIAFKGSMLKLSSHVENSTVTGTYCTNVPDGRMMSAVFLQYDLRCKIFSEFCWASAAFVQ